MGNFKVVGGSIITRKGDLREEGSTITTEEMGASEAEHLKYGKITPIATPEVGNRSVEAPAPAKDAKFPMFPTQTAHKAPTQQQTLFPTKPVGTLTGIWTLHVADIKNKSLAELNAMIIERDHTVAPFDDRDEAIAFLSQDVK